MAPTPDPERAPERIYVRLPTWVGDVVMATPALRSLAAAYPDAAIICEGRAHLAELVVGLPGIAEYWPDPGRRARDMATRVRRIRKGRFDLAVVLPDSHRAALGPWLARVRRRIGYARDLGRRTMLTHSLPIPLEDGKRKPASMVEQFLGITRALRCPDAGRHMEVPVDETARASVTAKLVEAGVDVAKPYLVAVPGASYGTSKQWPATHFAHAAEELHRARGLPLVLAPGPGEEPLAHAVAGAMETPVTVLENPAIGLLELAALIEGAALCVSNDTGPRHFAVALRTPVVVPMGPMDARYTAHQLELQRPLTIHAECAPCGLSTCPIDHHCMTDLFPVRVVEAALELLGDQG